MGNDTLVFISFGFIISFTLFNIFKLLCNLENTLEGIRYQIEKRETDKNSDQVELFLRQALNKVTTEKKDKRNHCDRC
uniref:Uncharacterized protein n=1 Tax=Siphoviridae sp. ctt0Q14 TaxID=2826489 RepID=A0A8S5QWE9_9CAUD|nr:MAG TPA: hypothetical protein [Siphoviridae sp. ctt0Q14]